MYNPRYFSEDEFQKIGCSMADVDTSLLVTLDALRSLVGEPLVLTSAYRSLEQNQKAGGKPNSAHLKGLAVDIACCTSRKRYAIVMAALRLGIRRIGIGKSFVHIDTDSTLPQDVTWLY